MTRLKITEYTVDMPRKRACIRCFDLDLESEVDPKAGYEAMD